MTVTNSVHPGSLGASPGGLTQAGLQGAAGVGLGWGPLAGSSELKSYLVNIVKGPP